MAFDSSEVKKMCDKLPAEERRSLQEERDLEEVQRLSELFKFYLELVLKIFVGTLGIAGAVTSFVLGKDVLDRTVSAVGLLLPALFCIGVGFGLLGATFTSFQIDSALR